MSEIVILSIEKINKLIDKELVKKISTEQLRTEHQEKIGNTDTFGFFRNYLRNNEPFTKGMLTLIKQDRFIIPDEWKAEVRLILKKQSDGIAYFDPSQGKDALIEVEIFDNDNILIDCLRCLSKRK